MTLLAKGQSVEISQPNGVIGYLERFGEGIEGNGNQAFADRQLAWQTRNAIQDGELPANLGNIISHLERLHPELVTPSEIVHFSADRISQVHDTNAGSTTTVDEYYNDQGVLVRKHYEHTQGPTTSSRSTIDRPEYTRTRRW